MALGRAVIWAIAGLVACGSALAGEAEGEPVDHTEAVRRYRAAAATLNAYQKTGEKPIRERYELACWCRKHQKWLGWAADLEFRQVLQLDPYHAGAGKALGYVTHQGRWVSKEEKDRLEAEKKREAVREKEEHFKTLFARFVGQRAEEGSTAGELEKELVQHAKQNSQPLRKLVIDVEQSVERRCAAIWLLGRARLRRDPRTGGDNLEMLLKLALSDPEVRIRAEAAAALVAFKDRGVLRFLVDLVPR